MSRLLYNNKFIDPDISDKKDNLFKTDERYKLKEIQKQELNKEDLIDIDKNRITKERITIINVDSRDRNINPKNVFSNDIFTLKNNPLEFKIGTNKISILLENNNLKLNDKISFNNIIGRQIKLKHRIILKKDSKYVKIIDENHDMTYEYHNKNIQVEISNVKGDLLENKINSKNKFKKIDIKTGTSLAGIPINLFNKKHNILFNVLDIDPDDPINNDSDIINIKEDILKIKDIDINELSNIEVLETKLESVLVNNLNPLNNINNLQNIVNKLVPNFYLIKLPKEASRDYIPNKETRKDLENSSVTFKYIHLFGINLNSLNANYPLTINNKQGYHIISKIINKDRFEFCIEGVALEPKDIINSNKLLGGGICVELLKVINIFDGYPNSNHYKIFFKRTLHNIKRVELIGSIFPNTDKVFRSNPPEKQNNKLYWNILNDGDKIYSIEITPGNYTFNELEKEICNKAGLVNRVTYTEQINMINNTFNIDSITNNPLINLDPIPKNLIDPLCWSDEFNSIFNDIDKKTIMKPTINIYTSVVKFNVYERMFLDKSIGSFDLDTGSFVVVHPFHPYNTYDEGNVFIEINGSDNIIENNITYSKDSINKSHRLLKIIDSHRYRVEFLDYILLPNNYTNYNNDSTIDTTNITSNNGGNNIVLTYPIKFRLLFDKPDTMGNELGFNLVGENDSITQFSYEVNNVDLYENEPNYDSLGIVFPRKKLTLSLTGDNYIFMTNYVLSNFQNTGLVDNIFAKIQLSENPDEYVYNTFINSPKIFEDPLNFLSELEFRFYNYDGSLYDFNNADHSFCLRITEIINLPDNTHINTRTGAKLQTFSDQGLLTY